MAKYKLPATPPQRACSSRHSSEGWNPETFSRSAYLDPGLRRGDGLFRSRGLREGRAWRVGDGPVRSATHVVPAKAGIQKLSPERRTWTPAYAGVQVEF